MFTQLSTWYPMLGKEEEMLARGTEFVKARQAKGERYALLTRLYSPIGTAITVARRFNDLAEADAARATNLADADFQAAVVRANALSRMPNTQRLRENIVPPNATGAMKYIQGTTIYPAMGNHGAVRTMLTERVQSEQAQRGIGLQVDLYDPEGQVFIVTVYYASLSAVEEHRKANAQDAAFQKLASELAKLNRKPATAFLTAVVVGMPQ